MPCSKTCPCGIVCALLTNASNAGEKLIRMQEHRSEAADAEVNVGSLVDIIPSDALQPLWHT